MDEKQLKALAAKFGALAHDKEAIQKVADERCAANPNDAACADLCARFTAAPDAKAVQAIAAEFAAPHGPPGQKRRPGSHHNPADHRPVR